MPTTPHHRIGKTPTYLQISLLGLGLLWGMGWGLAYLGRVTPLSPAPSIRTCRTWVELRTPNGQHVLRCLNQRAPARQRAELNRALQTLGVSCFRFGSKTQPLQTGTSLHIVRQSPGARCTLKRKMLNAHKRVLLRIPLSLNAETPQALAAIPGISPRLAEKIVRYRQRHGGFRTIDSLTQVCGIGPKTLKKIRPYLTLK